MKIGEIEKWDLYLEASYDMIKHTNMNEAPWHVIPADHKRQVVLKYYKQSLIDVKKCCKTISWI